MIYAIQSKSPSKASFEVSAQEIKTTNYNEPSQSAVEDVLYDVVGSDIVEQQIVVNQIPAINTFKFRSLDTGIFTVNETGYCSRVANGNSYCVVTANNGYEKYVRVKIDSSAIETFNSFVSGSASRAVYDYIKLKASDYVEGAESQFTLINYETSTVIKNPDFWLSGADLTGVAFLPSNGKARSLITPRHLIGTAHLGYQLNIGDSVWFLDSDNVIQKRTVLRKKVSTLFDTLSPYYADITVYLLSSDLPGTVKPLKILPSNYANLFPSLNSGQLPVVWFNQFEQWGCKTVYNTFESFSVPTDADFYGRYIPAITLDSGNPSIMLGLGDPILISCVTYGGTGSGSSVVAFKDDINSLISDVDTLEGISTGYTLTEADLSAYTAY